MDVWVEKYRPKDLEDLILRESEYYIFKSMVDKKELSGNLLFYGKPGIGKTTIAKILAKKVSDDVLFINASSEGNIDFIRNKLKTFAEMQSMNFKLKKVVILDEFDGFRSKDAFDALRPLIEQYSSNLRIIATCNYIQKIPDPIQSRFQSFEFFLPTKDQIISYVKDKILSSEKVEFSDDDLFKIYKSSCGDVRKFINNLQKSVINGKIVVYYTDLLSNFGKVFKERNIENLKFFLANNDVDYLQIYRYIYDKSVNFQTLQILAEAMYRDYYSIDKEINFVDCVIKIWSVRG